MTEQLNNNQNNGNNQDTAEMPSLMPSIDFKEYLRIIYRRIWLIIGITILVIAFVAYNTFTTQPIYRTSTTVQVNPNNQTQSSQIFTAPMVNNSRTQKNQIEYLKSRTLAEDVVRKLQDSEYANTLYLFGNRNEDQSNFIARIIGYPQKLFQKLSSIVKDKPDTSKNLDHISQNSDDIASKKIRSRAIRLRSWISVSPIRETDIIKISVSAPDGKEAALIANTIADVYYNHNVEIARDEVQQIKSFISDQLEVVKGSLYEAEQNLKQYQQNADAIALEQSTSELITRISEIRGQLNNTTIERQTAQHNIEYFRSRLSEQEKEFVDNLLETAPPFIEALRKALAEKQVKLTLLQSNMEKPTDNHPAIIRVKEHIKKLQKQIKETSQKMIEDGMRNSDPISTSTGLIQKIYEAENKLSLLKSKENFLRQMADEYDKKLNQLPEKALKLARLKRDQQVNEKLFMLLRTRFEETKISEVGQMGNVRIIDTALPASSPIKPKVKSNLVLAIIVGLGLGIGVAFLLEYTDNTVKSPEQIKQLGLRVLGTVPKIKADKSEGKGFKLNGKKKKDPKAESIEARLITHFEPKSPVTESYRILRTNLEYIGPEVETKSILVSSPEPGEGKSTTAANLAIALTQLGKEVVLIDSDLRRPVIHKIFEVNREPGLTDILIGDQDFDKVIQKPGFEGLNLITTGNLPPNPAELLGSSSMRKLIEKLSQKYDKIIFDSPPTIAVADASIISTMVTDTLLVTSYSNTDVRALKRAKQQIQDVGGDIAGTVLNLVKRKRGYGYGNYYYQYYYSYY